MGVPQNRWSISWKIAKMDDPGKSPMTIRKPPWRFFGKKISSPAEKSPWDFPDPRAAFRRPGTNKQLLMQRSGVSGGNLPSRSWRSEAERRWLLRTCVQIEVFFASEFPTCVPILFQHLHVVPHVLLQYVSISIYTYFPYTIYFP